MAGVMGTTSSTTTARPLDNDVRARLSRAQTAQRALLDRVDGLLQRLMDAHSPTLSSFEQAWFDELERMRAEFGRLDTRVERAKARVEDLEPALERIKEEASGPKDKAGGVAAGAAGRKVQTVLGDRQVRSIEIKLAQE